jgi:hypothetical protein
MTQAEELLRDNRHEVLAVAHALERHKTVTGDDVRAIIDGTSGPLIDGRPYHIEAFREAAESYHEHMAQAHRSHDKPDVPLPEFPELALDASSTDGKAADNGQPPVPRAEDDHREEPVTEGTQPTAD